MRYIIAVISQFLQENYFSSTLDGQYEYLDFSGTNTTLLFLVGGLLIGIILASFMAYYQKSIVGRLVRRLLRDKVHTVENAVSLAEENGAIKRELSSRSSTLRKLLSYEEDGVIYDYKSELSERMATKEKEEEKADKEQGDTPKKKNPLRRFFGKDEALIIRRPDFTKARFFIPEDLAYRAELRYGKKPMRLLTPVLTVVACVILFFAALRLIPILVSMLDVTIGNVIGGIPSRGGR